MALTKVTSTGIADDSVTSAKIASTTVATADIACSAVTSAKINDGTITASDLNSTLDLSSKTVTLPGSATSEVDQNIALLGFKMAVNEGLTVFNLVDGVVDEFHDESGTDEGEGSNDLYNSSDDYYVNSTSPTGSGSAVATNVFSNAFTATSAPSTARIVVFQENVDSITLNTDIIASISRDGGTTFTTATLSDSGYVTGSSGQRILHGTAIISGQPSGTSMRWKLALANNQMKIHGVGLHWK